MMIKKDEKAAAEVPPAYLDTNRPRDRERDPNNLAETGPGKNQVENPDETGIENRQNMKKKKIIAGNHAVDIAGL